MKAIADTGFIIAFARENDEHHEWAVSIASQISEPALTCEPVLAEIAFHLKSSSYVLSLIDNDLLRIAFRVADHLSQLSALAERFENRHPDLADLCLIRMSEMYPRHTVITVDEADFSVYRRNKREVIPMLCPLHK